MAAAMDRIENLIQVIDKASNDIDEYSKVHDSAMKKIESTLSSESIDVTLTYSADSARSVEGNQNPL